MNFWMSNIFGIPTSSLLIVIGLIVARVAETRQFSKTQQSLLFLIGILLVFCAGFWLGALIASGPFSSLI